MTMQFTTAIYKLHEQDWGHNTNVYFKITILSIKCIFQNHHYYTLLWESKGSSTGVMMPYDDAIDAVEGEI